MRIVELSEYYSPEGGGVRSYVHQKLALARQLGVDLTVIAPASEDGVDGSPGARLIRVRSPALPLDSRYHLFGRAAPIHRLLDQIEPDVLEVSSLLRAPAIAAAWPGRALRILFVHSDPVASYLDGARERYPGISWLANGFARPVWAYLRHIQKSFQKTVVPSVWLAERLESFGLERPAAVPLGVEKDVFHPGRRDERLRADFLTRLGLPVENGRLVLSVGRLHPEKHVDVIVKACLQLAATHPVGLVIVGDGPLRRRVQRIAQRHERIMFLGRISSRATLAKIMASADVFAHACPCETFGLAVGEAICSGCPIVLPDRGAVRSFARNTFAEAVEDLSVPGYAQALGRLLSRDITALRQAARAFAESAFLSPLEHFRHLFALYGSLMGRSQAACGAMRPSALRILDAGYPF